jgi:hypothetical protein
MKIRLIIPNSYVSGAHAMVIDPVYQYGPRIADIAGGFTAWQAVGGWKDDKGLLIVEPVTVIDCDMTIAPGHVGAWRDLARTIAKDLHQTCVYLEIDGIVEYVKPA